MLESSSHNEEDWHQVGQSTHQKRVYKTVFHHAVKDPVHFLAHRNWQKRYDVRIGKVILIRRSTHESAPEGTIVITRWRTLSEFKKQKFSATNPAAKSRARLGVKGKFSF